MTFKNYIKNLSFEYFETYSLLRGEINSSFERNIKNEIDELRMLTKEPKFGWYRQVKRLADLEKYISGRQYLLGDNKKLHPTSEKKSTICKTDQGYKYLIEILSKEFHILDDFETVCLPVFRDAIVFYDTQGKISSVLNICFTCKKMETDKHEIINGHINNYTELKDFLNKLGHDLTDDFY